MPCGAGRRAGLNAQKRRCSDRVLNCFILICQTWINEVNINYSLYPMPVNISVPSIHGCYNIGFEVLHSFTRNGENWPWTLTDSGAWMEVTNILIILYGLNIDFSWRKNKPSLVRDKSDKIARLQNNLIEIFNIQNITADTLDIGISHLKQQMGDNQHKTTMFTTITFTASLFLLVEAARGKPRKKKFISCRSFDPQLWMKNPENEI